MISLKEYKKLRELLHGSEEDFAVGCENIKNMDITSVTRMMFAKSLMSMILKNGILCLKILMIL